MKDEFQFHLKNTTPTPSYGAATYNNISSNPKLVGGTQKISPLPLLPSKLGGALGQTMITLGYR